MTNSTTVRPAVFAELEDLAVLFDQFRQFQGQASDLPAARSFLSVSAEHRRRGVACRLLDAVEAYAWSHAAARVTLNDGGNSTIVYFACTDCAVEARRAAASGGTIFKEKFSIGPHGFVALVTDTEGNRIGLHSRQ